MAPRLCRPEELNRGRHHRRDAEDAADSITDTLRIDLGPKSAASEAKPHLAWQVEAAFAFFGNMKTHPATVAEFGVSDKELADTSDTFSSCMNRRPRSTKPSPSRQAMIGHNNLARVPRGCTRSSWNDGAGPRCRGFMP